MSTVDDDVDDDLDQLPLSTYVRNLLRRNDIRTVAQLQRTPFQELCSFRGMGATSGDALIDVLRALTRPYESPTTIAEPSSDRIAPPYDVRRIALPGPEGVSLVVPVLTETDLVAIATRAAVVARDENSRRAAWQLAVLDVPILLAEVRRLRQLDVPNA